MATRFTDRNGVVWETLYDAPSFGQIHPWQGLSPGYTDFPHLFAFTESGLHDDIQGYAATHVPRTPVPAATPPGAPTVTYKELTDARGVRWTLRTDSLPATAGRWRGFTNSSAYGLPKPDFTAPTEALLRAEIAAYVVGHPTVPAPPPPGTTPPAGGGPVSPVVQPARAPAPVGAIAALIGFVAILLSRRP